MVVFRKLKIAKMMVMMMNMRKRKKGKVEKRRKELDSMIKE